MAFVVSGGATAGPGGISPGLGAWSAPGLDVLPPLDRVLIWRTQPQVRTVISFLARNIAQLGLHTYRRVDDNDRQRVTDHPLALLLNEPLPRFSLYRLIERLVSDLALHDVAYWVKFFDGERRMLAPIPPTLIRPRGGSWLGPEKYETAGGQTLWPEQVVHFRGYTPEDMRVGSSTLDALADLLREDREATGQRTAMWRNGMRATGVLTRPADAAEWNPDERRRFREMWRTFTQGGGAEGGTPILEDGMDYKQVSIDPQKAQYIEARKLTREEVAAAFHIPLPMVGILDHATFSNIKEQHRQLYQDTLGPWLQQIQQDIAVQLLPDFEPPGSGVYVEFNISEKMRGSFEEQAAAASTATGGPWMTRNEQRARFNLPRVDGGDDLIVPMNVTAGGLASPRDTAPPPKAAPKTRSPAGAKADEPDPPAYEVEQAGFAAALAQWAEQQGGRLADVLGDEDALPSLLPWTETAPERTAELAATVRYWLLRIAAAGAWEVLAEFNPTADGWDPAVMEAWLAAAATTHAAQLVQAGDEDLADRVADPDLDTGQAVAGAREALLSTAALRAATAGTEARSFGGHDAADASGLVFKTWRTGSKPRPEHARMDGETVRLGETFSNGLRWPGDSAGSSAQTANCNCDLTYARAEE
ncbi:phage portal protein [Streptomyces sp. DSM 42041]|uniref:Phage portal protein n=1 Tax=Streptomyces hazeniae TaxID=3075538 RepID=A0ABU2NWR5_9ACTN|nr:phage portal protein [Streptomyces sp. DSM 42041]MDT0381425.1 phage portal protein [Streptomyces sp. DSM 42041]